MSLIQSIISKFVVIQSLKSNFHVIQRLCISHLICVYIKLHSGFLFTVYMSKGSKDYIMYTIDTFNAMLKGSKDYVMYKRLCYLHHIDTLNAMLKGSKNYVMHTI